MTFTALRLASTCLSGAREEAGGLIFQIGPEAMCVTRSLGQTLRSQNFNLSSYAARYAKDPGSRYLHPVIATFQHMTFSGFIDTDAATLTIQVEQTQSADQSLSYAICGAAMRSISDRATTPLPARIVPFHHDLYAILKAAPVADFSQYDFHTTRAAA